MFRQKKQPLLGIDISSSAVKMLELAKIGNRYAIESYAAEPLPINTVIEGRIDNIGEATGAVKRAVKASGSKIKEVAAAIPVSAAMNKIVALPASLSEHDMEDQAIYEAENFISRPLDEVMIGFDVLGPSAQGTNNVDVLIAAGLTEVVTTYTTVLKQAGLKPVIIDVESYAVEKAFSLIARQLPNHGQDLNVALIDVGSTTTGLYIITNGAIIFNHEQQFGGLELTENIERHYGISYQEAGLAKKKRGEDALEGYDSAVLNSFKDSIVTIIKRGLQFFYSNSVEQRSVDYVVLSGGCALIEGIGETLEKEIDIPTSIANPFSNMVFGRNVERGKLKHEEPMLLSACGLAMRRL